MGGIPLRTVEEFKDLGVTINQKGTFKNHKSVKFAKGLSRGRVSDLSCRQPWKWYFLHWFGRKSFRKCCTGWVSYHETFARLFQNFWYFSLTSEPKKFIHYIAKNLDLKQFFDFPKFFYRPFQGAPSKNSSCIRVAELEIRLN